MLFFSPQTESVMLGPCSTTFQQLPNTQTSKYSEALHHTNSCNLEKSLKAMNAYTSLFQPFPMIGIYWVRETSRIFFRIRSILQHTILTISMSLLIPTPIGVPTIWSC